MSIAILLQSNGNVSHHLSRKFISRRRNGTGNSPYLNAAPRCDDLVLTAIADRVLKRPGNRRAKLTAPAARIIQRASNGASVAISPRKTHSRTQSRNIRAWYIRRAEIVRPRWNRNARGGEREEKVKPCTPSTQRHRYPTILAIVRDLPYEMS